MTNLFNLAASCFTNEKIKNLLNSRFLLCFVLDP